LPAAVNEGSSFFLPFLRKYTGTFPAFSSGEG
jgi:hypothetical protein